MADNEIDQISDKLDELQDEFESVHAEAGKRRLSIQASRSSPSKLLENVFETLMPLTAFVVADGDVTRAELVDKAQNDQLKTLIKPVLDAFAAANGHYKESRTASEKLKADTTEDLASFESIERQLNGYGERLVLLKQQNESRRVQVQNNLNNFQCQRDILQQKQDELEQRRTDNDRVIHLPDDEPLWKKIGWGLACTIREEGQDMSDGEMLTESCRRDQEAIDDEMEVNDEQIENTERLIQEYNSSLETINDSQESITDLIPDVQDKIADGKAIVANDKRDITALDEICESMTKMYSLLCDATAKAKVGFKLAYRKTFAEMILTILMEVPMDNKVGKQIVPVVRAFDNFPQDSSIYTDLKPKIEAARSRPEQSVGPVMQAI